MKFPFIPVKISGVLLAAGAYFLLAGVEPAPLRAAGYPDVFEEIVTIVREHFYDPGVIARDFPAIEAAYRTRLAQVSGQEGFSRLVNAMLGELNASHTYYLTPDDCEYYQLSALFSQIPEIGALFQGRDVRYPSVGILTQAHGKRLYIADVLPGSAADRAGLLKGDEILSANGRPFAPIASLRPYVGKEVPFRIRRREQGAPFVKVLQPVLINPKEELLQAQQASVRIIEHSGARIGYVHLYSYAGAEYHEELRKAIMWGPLKDADALIIDLRYGLGGAWVNYLNIFNRDIPRLTMRDRDGTETVMDTQWRKPAVYLVNACSRSGKELLVYGAKKYRLATVIGERTPGQVLGGRLFPLSDGTALFLAVQSCRIDGVDLEGVGVAPDIEVPFDVRYCAGQDVQLEKAVDFLAEQAGGRPGK